MRKSKLLSLLAGLLVLAVLFAGCGTGESSSSQQPSSSSSESSESLESEESSEVSSGSKTQVNVTAIKGPTGIGMVNLMEENAAGNTANDYVFQVVAAPEEVVGKISTGEVDIAAVPTNLAATLYTKTSGNLQILAVNTLGVLYVMENGDNVQSVADLKGKTIYSTGKGPIRNMCCGMCWKRTELIPTRM